MTALSALWLPILLSAVVVFIASSIVHMVQDLACFEFALGDVERAEIEGLLR